MIFQVQRHLSKLFDNMAKLKFKQDDEGEDTKIALGMYSKEGEYVDFDKECECTGQVSSILWSLVYLVNVWSTNDTWEQVYHANLPAKG